MTLWTLYLLRSIVIGANIIQTAKFGKPYPQHNIDEWMIYKYEKAKYVCKNVFLKKITKYKQLDILNTCFSFNYYMQKCKSLS